MELPKVLLLVGAINDPLLETSFGSFAAAGEYVVIGSMPGSGCDGVVGSIILTEDALPEVFELTGDDGYCAGGGNALIELSGSESNVELRTISGWFCHWLY
jgi:hypothetical protein